MLNIVLDRNAHVARSFVKKTRIKAGYMKNPEKREHPRRTIWSVVLATTDRRSPFHRTTPALVFSSEEGSMMKPEIGSLAPPNGPSCPSFVKVTVRMYAPERSWASLTALNFIVLLSKQVLFESVGHYFGASFVAC